MLAFALAHAGLLAGVVLVLAVGAGFLFSRLGAQFVRKLDEGSIATMVGASTSFDMKPGGLHCEIRLPRPDGGSAQHSANRANGDEPTMLPTRPDDLP